MHLSTRYLVPLVGILSIASATPSPSIPDTDTNLKTAEEAQRACEIRDAFMISWDGYYQYAFPNDELRPVNNTFQNRFNDWGLSVVDALSTVVTMGLSDIVEKSLDFIETIDYTVDKTDSKVSLFETNIRHFAGLLSSHDLLTGPFVDLIENRTKIDVLLVQATTLADTLKYAFETPTGIPVNTLFINNRTTDQATGTNPAQVGTLILEWTRLSDKTGNPEYTKLAQKAESYLLDPDPYGEVWPGLIGIDINPYTGLFNRTSYTGRLGGWIGGLDSFYEYLIKMYVYDPARFGFYKDRWVAAADSTITHLAVHPTTRPDITFLAEHNSTQLEGNGQALACFAGGSYILGGLVLGEQRYVDFGIQLVEGCENTYHSVRTNLGPDMFKFNIAPTAINNNVSNFPVPLNQTTFYQNSGFWIDPSESRYSLGAESPESFYYAYRATGDRKYQDYLWDAFENIRRYCRVGSGFSVLENPNIPSEGYTNDQPSFFLAETLKYMFLAHSPDNPVQVIKDEGKEWPEWVFNTECHPMRVVRGDIRK